MSEAHSRLGRHLKGQLMSAKKKVLAPFTIIGFAAHHEAGHAVVARKLGVDVRLVSAQGRETIIEAPWRFTNRMDAAGLIGAFQRDMLLTLAGPIADYRYLVPRAVNPMETVRAQFDMYEGYDPDDDPDDDDRDADMVRVRACISSVAYLRDGGDPYRISPDAKGSAYRPTLMPVSEETISAEFDQYEAEATRLVDQHWRAIERVAKSVERRDLRQADLDRLIG
jgi:hypothetical protein